MQDVMITTDVVCLILIVHALDVLGDEILVFVVIAILVSDRDTGGNRVFLRDVLFSLVITLER